MNNLKKAMTDSISEVLETMFFLTLDFPAHQEQKRKELDTDPTTMTCRLYFSGRHSGSLFVMLPKRLVTILCENFMGINPDEIKDPQLEGTIKELTNMIGGNTFSNLDNQLEIQLGIPEVMDRKTTGGEKPAPAEREVHIIAETEDGLIGVMLVSWQ